MVGGGRCKKVRSRGSTHPHTHNSCLVCIYPFSIYVALTSVPSSLWRLHLDIFFKQTIDTNLQKQPFSIFLLHFDSNFQLLIRGCCNQAFVAVGRLNPGRIFRLGAFAEVSRL